MSFLFCPFYKFFLKDELKDSISSKINEIQTSSSWRYFDLGLTASEIKSSHLRYEDVCKHLEIWEDLAKLSVDLWRDFYYYARFTFEGRYADREYTQRLEDLGCECVDGRWRSVRRPQEESVQTNVFMWRLHALLVEQIERPPGKTGPDRLEECPFCRVALTAANGPCGNCEATSEDILNQRIVEGRAQQAEKRREGVTVRLGRDIRGASSDHSTQTEGSTVMVGVQCDIRGVSSGTQTEGTPTASCDTQWEDVHEVGASRVNLSGVRHHNGGNIEDCIGECPGRKEEMSKKNVEEKGRANSIKDKLVTKRSCVRECPFCDYDLDEEACKCDLCEASLDEMSKYIRANANKKEAYLKCGVINQISTKNDDFLDNKSYQERAIECINDGVKVGKREEEIKWKCGACQLLNGYGMLNCEACGRAKDNKEGTNASFDENILNNLETNKNKRIEESKVKYRIKNQNSTNINEMSDNKSYQERAEECRRKEDGHWQCKYTDCGAWSKNVDMFCCKCGIWKGTPFDTLTRGAAVQRLKYGRTTTAWICAICCTINDTSKDVCSSWICWRTRYGKRECPHCGEESDGKSNFCGTCKVTFTDA